MKTNQQARNDTGNPDHLDSLINEQVAAAFLGYTVRALQNWRVRGGGPHFIKVSSRSIRYRRRDLLAWTEERRFANTTEADAAARA
ncbi:MAG: helix-turn-helix domain-containing protein [Alphaproteobacteria bacterium]|nr:helix-turn-helix domain-containing protein [Alphaproteobacteria bacterium]